MPGTKGVQRVGAEEQHAEYMALKAKLLYWLHKDLHCKSVEKARQNDFLLRLEVRHAALSGSPCLNIPLSQVVHFRFVGSWRKSLGVDESLSPSSTPRSHKLPNQKIQHQEVGLTSCARCRGWLTHSRVNSRAYQRQAAAGPTKRRLSSQCEREFLQEGRQVARRDQTKGVALMRAI